MGPSENTVNLVLHPVRLRIIQTLLGGRRLTTGEIAKELDDVTSATLYRQVATLAKAGILDVVEERRVRGAVERTYELHVEAAEVPPEVLVDMTPQQHQQSFVTFVSSLLASFDGYVRGGAVDMVRDRVGYRQTALWLSDDEVDAMIADMRAVVAARAGNGPGRGRRRRVLSTVLIPDPAGDEPAGDDSGSQF